MDSRQTRMYSSAETARLDSVLVSMFKYEKMPGAGRNHISLRLDPGCPETSLATLLPNPTMATLWLHFTLRRRAIFMSQHMWRPKWPFWDSDDDLCHRYMGSKKDVRSVTESLNVLEHDTHETRTTNTPTYSGMHGARSPKRCHQTAFQAAVG